MHFKGIIRFVKKELSGWFIEFPDDVHEKLGLPKNSRVLVELSGETMHRALRLSSNGYNYIGLNNAFAKKHRLIENEEVDVKLSADTSEFGMDFTEEMQEVMEQDEEGKALFYALNPGSQRGFLHYIASGKAVQTRVNRALHVMNRVRELAAEGKIKGYEPE